MDSSRASSERLPGFSANLALALFLVAECTYGILSDSDDAIDVAWWLVVTGILVINVARRAAAIEQDTRWFVWVLCVASTLHFLGFEGDRDSRVAEWMLVLIILAGDLNLIYLGRSFAILPARREIKRGFAYRIVRHPIYATYMLADVVYLTQVPTPRNFAVFAVAVGLFGLRATLEERVLSNDPVYREYARETRWRFLPFVY